MDRDVLIHNLGIGGKTPEEINTILIVFEEEIGKRIQNMLEEVLSDDDIEALSQYSDVIEYQKYLTILIPDAKNQIEKIQNELVENYKKNT